MAKFRLSYLNWISRLFVVSLSFEKHRIEFVLVSIVTLIEMTLLGRWIFFRGGAKMLEATPGLLRLEIQPFGKSLLPNKPPATAYKIIWCLSFVMMLIDLSSGIRAAFEAGRSLL